MTKSNVYKVLLFSLLLSVSTGVVAIQEESSYVEDIKDGARSVASAFTQDFSRGPVGWLSHAGIAYFVASRGRSPLGILAVGAVGTYHANLFLGNWWKFSCDLNDMTGPNTSTNPAERNVWADCADAPSLWDRYNRSNPIQKNVIRKQLFHELGFEKMDPKIHTKLNTAFTFLRQDLDTYSKYTNILDYIAYDMIRTYDHDKLLVANRLISYDLNTALDTVLSRYASNSWVANSVTGGLIWKKRWPIRAPKLYTATYNKASHCVALVLKQYARLKVIKFIIEQSEIR
jgi:hypothetical protein